MTALSITSDPLARAGGLAMFLAYRLTAAVLLSLVATAVLLVGVQSGGWGGAVNLEHHDREAAEELHDAQDR